MSLETVKADLAARAPDLSVIVTEDSTATVDLAAAVHGVEPGQIAKTLAIRVGDSEFLLVTRGDARLSTQKAIWEFERFELQQEIARLKAQLPPQPNDPLVMDVEFTPIVAPLWWIIATGAETDNEIELTDEDVIEVLYPEGV